ncbi:MAG: phosphatidylinositol mannoside acyltransferase [Candidatus Nanopelagicaceae bacterium]|nr:phosphatidylinositol mannoside acyltransferase [Candidatus Nanopelagicaceae bacterium]
MAWLTYILYSSLWFGVRKIPERSAYTIFNFLAILAHKRNGKRVIRLRSNYRAVRPESSSSEIETLVIDGLKSAMRYWCDTFRISDWSKERVVNSVTSTGEEYLLKPIEQGRGLIVALPHAGNWDHAGAYFCARGVRVNTVAEHLKPERLFRRFLAHREAMGMQVLDLNAGVFTELEELLNRGELVALVADRDLSRSGVDVNFFGKIARMPAGPALLAYKTKADLITAYVSYTDTGIHIKFTPPISIKYQAEQKGEIERVTQLLANQFEKDILGNLTSWHMQQRIFIDNGFVERS